MTKFLLDHGYISLSDSFDKTDLAKMVLTIHSCLIRDALLEPSVNFPQGLPAIIRSVAHTRINYILKTNDQQLIDELLPNKVNVNPEVSPQLVRSLRSYNLPSLSSSTVEQYWKHIERMSLYGLITDDLQLLHIKAIESLAQSKEKMETIVGVVEDGSRDGTFVDDQYRLIVIKIILARFDPINSTYSINQGDALRSYIKTGDCTLIPFFVSMIKDSTVHGKDKMNILMEVIQDGTWTQAKVLTALFDSYTIVYTSLPNPIFNADNSPQKLKILQQLNLNEGVVLDMVQRVSPFQGSLEMLQFLVSDTNRVIRFMLIYPDIAHLSYVINNAPALINLEEQFQLAVKMGHHDMVDLLFKNYTPPSSLNLLRLTMAGRPQYSMFKKLLDHGVKPNETTFERIGYIGDVELVSILKQSDRLYDSGPCIFIARAIKVNQTEFIRYIYNNHPTPWMKKQFNFRFHLDSIKMCNVELLDLILSLDPLEIDWKTFNDLVATKKSFIKDPLYTTILSWWCP
ncbi:hypothetical protein SAMD00019534_052930 [Acytostelium subglobosum LB1]|uniref:hypothetical protein n=1 Tax=Acytostelium subglobosum LB1 TaxID=1410327 RepID=UPI0006449948|nr:hypothetical protein SAMD00019534_052930 [Acytostelium subglobosum LB1]GAM22118.1 hypothetical protein SAMD00019534_052930 [Acytostelium subglobosum LB1]|eukprot:XP_012755218.1 hypothetical protein SAMD00019534_052930 [Acytostelium subglobosum LB1]